MSKIRVLFLAANPADQTQLQLEAEVEAIKSRIEASEFGDEIEIVPHWQASPDDVVQLLNEDDDWTIIHFSGHSIFKPGNKQISDRGYIFLPGERAIPVKIMTVVEWFRKASLVYMSSCQSAEPAFVNALAEEGGIPTIIGFRWQVSSLGATQFAGLFYLNLFRDKTGDIESAFVEAQRCLVDPGKYPLPREIRKNKIWANPEVKAGASPMLVMQDV